MKSAAVALAAAAALAACGGGSLSVTQGHVRLVNATTGVGALDLYEGSNQISSNVAASTAGPYVGLDPDAYTFNLSLHGSSATAATVNGSVQKKNDYSLVAYTTGGTLTATYLAENEGSPSSGTAKLRLFNTDAADVPSVDAYLLTSDCSGLSTSPAAPVITGVTGLQSSFTQVNAASGGTAYHLCITATGDKTSLRLDIPSLTLSDGQIVTVILTRSTGGVLLNGMVMSQKGSVSAVANASTRIRLAVGTAGGALVTATVDGVSLGTNLPPSAVGSYVAVPSGPITLAATVGGVAVADPGLTAVPGADMTLLVSGTAATAPILLQDDNSVSTSASSPVKLRLVNGMNGIDSASLTDDYNPVGTAAAFGATSGYAQMTASAALARIEATDAALQLCLSTGVTLNAGSVYSVFLLGDPPTSVPTCTIRADR